MSNVENFFEKINSFSYTEGWTSYSVQPINSAFFVAEKKTNIFFHKYTNV
jgi:hypothetical protein